MLNIQFHHRLKLQHRYNQAFHFFVLELLETIGDTGKFKLAKYLDNSKATKPLFPNLLVF